MNENNHDMDSWVQDSYETGSTRPPKSRGGLVAVLLVLVILLCGATSYLGVLNIRLGQQLEQFDSHDVPIEFVPATVDPDESADLTDEVLPGVEGRTVSQPEQSFYHWPAGVVVTRVLPGSEAAAAGLAIGDIITSVNGQTITDMESLGAVLQNVTQGAEISVAFCRDGTYYGSYQCTQE